jgi:hypothetical protein
VSVTPSIRPTIGGRPAIRSGPTTPLGREIQYTLLHAQNYIVKLPRVEPDPLLLLRAARACWLVDERDAMCVYYREAATQLLEVVDLNGRRTGTSSEYWRLVLGALWMAANHNEDTKERTSDQAALRSTAYKVLDVAQRMALAAGQPLDRISLELSRLRGAWYAGDLEFPRTLSQVDQRAGALDVNNRGLWAGERDQLTLAAIKTITLERPERMGAPLTALDEYITQAAPKPPTIMDLVDEELLALEAAAIKKGARLDRLRAAPKCGARKAELGAG